MVLPVKFLTKVSDFLLFIFKNTILLFCSNILSFQVLESESGIVTVKKLKHIIILFYFFLIKVYYQ